MENNEKVSVIIPTYNRGWVLKKAIDSVFSQDYSNFELIVVDDGSTDDTKSIIKEYGDNILYLYQENGGVSSARNFGIKNSSGSLIALLDSDDVWMEGKLDAQVKFFHQNKGSVICQTEEIWIRNGKRVNPMKKHRKIAGYIFKESLHLCLISPSAVMMRKSLFDEIGLFDESLLSCEDYDLWLRVLLKHPVDLIESPYIYKYGGHDDQLSKAFGLDKYRILSLKKLLENENLNKVDYEDIKEVLNKKCEIYAKGCEKREKFDEASYFRDLALKY